MSAIPQGLAEAFGPVTVIVGHYGSGKTNLSVNLAIDAAALGRKATVVDLDVVNPYFRATEQRAVLEGHGVRCIAPVFAEAGTSLDVPSLTGGITPAIQDAGDEDLVIVDAGGDDVGATALGRFARIIQARGYAMLYVANRFRNLVQDPRDALVNLREIEAASHLSATAIVNNSHLKDQTTLQDVHDGIEYARQVAELSGLPLVCTTVPANIGGVGGKKLYAVRSFVKNPWEQ